MIFSVFLLFYRGESLCLLVFLRLFQETQLEGRGSEWAMPSVNVPFQTKLKQIWSKNRHPTDL